MSDTIYDYEAIDLTGKTVKLSDYRNKVLLIVNIASKCGETPQLKDIQEVYEKYRRRGFEVLAFPSNQFAGQEPLEGADIQQFCQVNYGVTFKVFAKGNVRGADKQEVYKFLTTKKLNGITNFQPLWNFSKYVLDRNGRMADYFWTWTSVKSDKVTEVIEKCLSN
jgi:glutathione peroxidase